MAYPNHPNCPSYSFTNSYKVHDGYRILHLPQLIYPTHQKTYAPSVIYLNTPTCGGSLILGGSTNFVSNPSAVQTVLTSDVICVEGSHAKIKAGSVVGEDYASVTGLKLPEGTCDGQHLWLMNEGTETVNFSADEATSRIKGGGGPLLAGRFYHFMWNATDSLWYREEH